MKVEPDMRVGIVFDDSLDSTDGVQQNILTLGEWFRSEGHEVHYLVGETTRTDIPNVHSLSRNIRVRFNGNTLSIPLPANRRRIRSLLAELQLDVLQVQIPHSPFMAGQVLTLSRNRSVMVAAFHTFPVSRFVVLAHAMYGWVIWPYKRYFSQVTTVSQPTADFARKWYGYNCQIVPNPVVASRFLSAHTAPSTVPTVVYLGRLVPRKGCMHLLRILADVRERHLYDGPLKVQIGGKGSELAALQQFVNAHALGDIVQFDGFIAEEDKAEYLAQADIAIFPSVSGEAFGISVVEGMLAARGVVLGGLNPGYASVMTGELAKQLFDVTNTTEAAQTLAWWLHAPDARYDAAQKQKALAMQYDVANVGRRLIDIYTEALQKHHKEA